MLAISQHSTPSSYKKILPEDPVYSYQNRKFEDIFCDQVMSAPLMTAVQHGIRLSIVDINKKLNKSSDELCITLNHVETSDSLGSKLDELKNDRGNLESISIIFKNLVMKELQDSNGISSNKYKHEIILKGIEDKNLLSVIYLLLGFDEQIQYDFITEVSMRVRD